MEFKIIFQGWLDFGSEKKFDRTVSLFQQRVENFYRFDVLFQEEDENVFRADDNSIVFTKYKVTGAEKSWQNSIKVLDFISQFAVAGRVESWLVINKEYRKRAFVEPKSDRQAVQEYLRGSQLLENGKEEEAIEALQAACERYEDHILAHERIGKAFFDLGKTKEALASYEKSLSKNLPFAEAHLGKAIAHQSCLQYEEAIKHMDLAIQQSLPLQPLHWEARRRKGACLLEMEDYENSIKEFRFFCNREFQKGDPNIAFQQLTFYQYGSALMEMGELEQALKTLENALSLEKESTEITIADILLLRGIVLKKAGRKGFVGALQEAADAGSAKAAEMLAEVA